MIKFKTITIKNFLSYGNVPTVIELDKPGTTLILGENLDESGAGANGVGKTALINAVAYAVYDKPISNISKDNLVNNINKKNMEVTVDFEVKGKQYKVTRARKAKAGAAGNTVVVYEDGVDITPDSSSNATELVEKIIGIPYDLFVRIVTFSATLIPFLDLPVRSPTAVNQSDIIEELFDLKTLSQKAEVLKEKMKETEQSLKTHKMRHEMLEKEHERHTKQLDAAQQRVDNWNAQHAQSIRDVQAKLDKVSKIDVESEKKLWDQLTLISTELKDLTPQRTTVNSEISSLTKSLAEKRKELTHLESSKCPYCMQKYEGAGAKVDKCSVFIETVSTQLDELKAELTILDEKIADLSKKKAQLQKQLTVQSLNELVELQNATAVLTDKLTQLNSTANPFLEPLKELEDVVLEPLSMTEINELTSTIEHQKFLQKLLTKKDSFVRKALLNKNIPFLNQRLSHYLKDLGLSHTVEFTHEMTAQITQFGRELDFGNLSNGQRARVNLALSFAFRDVLQSIHDKINICLLDEVLDVGLDTIGVQAAARMLKRKARDEKMALFIISHRDEIDSAFDRKMIVQLSKGFSNIIYEEN